ncbi:hypothetical protein LWI28_004705 [Acer negundo]|uniref:Germin-like protein n=1 Tax=Acer negundo TaxID=4023 RepID=A0AAD5NWD8_ACENE|nr:hypothetical protein LWI28_004705 [Acer negundo]KAK4850043.1 hypothetical protein QYF36_003329 [Acer negundo]
MKSVNFLLAFVLMAMASAYDPSPLQDYCVAINDTKSAIFVNGRFCKDPSLVTGDDFTFSGLNIPGDTNNLLGSNATLLTVYSFPGLNTLGITIARADFAPGGVLPPHIHPRGTELLLVQKGTIYAGFVDSNNTLFGKILYPGDVFVIPLALNHFQVNIGKTDGVILASFNSQNPGFIKLANSVFGTNPPIDPYALARAFQLDVNAVKQLQAKFSSTN